MYALAFDLVISDLQKYYGEPYNKAYYEIKELLKKNGFKFCTQPEWKGTHYGADFNTAPDAANITITEPPGYYKLDADLYEKK